MTFTQTRVVIEKRRDFIQHGWKRMPGLAWIPVNLAKLRKKTVCISFTRGALEDASSESQRLLLYAPNLNVISWCETKSRKPF